MPINYKEYHPKWSLISRLIRFHRANNRCEWCGVKNYSVGKWDGNTFIPTAGNSCHDAAGDGLLSYKEAKILVKHLNECCDDNLTIIVLTVAHIDHDKTNNKFSNLAALCQRCHLHHDRHQHAANRKYGRNWKQHVYKLNLK